MSFRYYPFCLLKIKTESLSKMRLSTAKYFLNATITFPILCLCPRAYLTFTKYSTTSEESRLLNFRS